MHDNANLLEELCIFKKLFFVSQIFPYFFLMINVQEDPRNNKSVESGLNDKSCETHAKCSFVWACFTYTISKIKSATTLTVRMLCDCSVNFDFEWACTHVMKQEMELLVELINY